MSLGIVHCDPDLRGQPSAESSQVLKEFEHFCCLRRGPEVIRHVFSQAFPNRRINCYSCPSVLVQDSFHVHVRTAVSASPPQPDVDWRLVKVNQWIAITNDSSDSQSKVVFDGLVIRLVIASVLKVAISQLDLMAAVKTPQSWYANRDAESTLQL